MCINKKLQKVSPEYYYAGDFEYYEKYDEYLARIEVVGKKDYEHYLINEDFDIVSSDIQHEPREYFHRYIIPEKVKSNKTYSRAMLGDQKQDYKTSL